MTSLGGVNERAGYGQHAPDAWPIFWTLSENSRLTGKYLLWRNSDSEGCLEACYGFTKRMGFKNEKLFENTYLDKPKQLTGAVTSISSNWSSGNNYYHWMVDALPRLAIRETLPEDTRIIIPRSEMAFVRESLSLLGLEKKCIIPDSNHVICERFYFLSPTAQTGHWNPFAYQWLRDSFVSHLATGTTYQKVFFTRKGCQRIPLNIIEIETLFRTSGFKIVNAGDLSLLQQIALASSATCIAGLHGAAMTNLLWSQKNIPVLEIFESSYLNACYENIALYNECAYSFMFCDSSDFTSKATDWIEQASS